MSNQKAAWYILPTIVFSLFTGTSLWFATNVIIDDLQALYNLPQGATDDILSAVQLGFMSGTLLFAFLNISDRMAPRNLFLICTTFGALLNSLILWWADSFVDILILRFLTGICLAGIYPVAIKIAATWFDTKILGKAMGYTVGALALGTAFPHIVKYLGASLDIYTVVYLVSGLALFGGIIMFFFVPNGPYLKPAIPFDPKNILKIFKNKQYKYTSLGYYGHMWELYAFWGFVPVWIHTFNPNLADKTVSLWSFFIMAFGFLGCVIGGYITVNKGSRDVASYNILISGLCCLLSPIVLQLGTPLFLIFMFIWGFMVLGDSPQFSTLVSKSVAPELIGTAITLMTCIGYTLSIFSIQLLKYLNHQVAPQYIYLFLAIGPLLGWISLRKVTR